MYMNLLPDSGVGANNYLTDRRNCPAPEPIPALRYKLLAMIMSGLHPESFARKLVIASGVVLLYAFTAGYAAAADANGNKIRHMPIKWCAVQGSPTVTSPGTVDPDNPGADTNTVLWRRHERVSDRIFLRLPASDAAHDVVPVTFRSAADQQTFLLSRSFPIIAGPNASGDVDVGNNQQVQALVQACDAAWGSSAPGIPVINVNHLFINGTPIGGEGYWGFATGSGDIGQHTTWSVAGNQVFIADRMYSANGDQDASLLGHELGHSLNMLHTDPVMNLMSIVRISSADPPHTLSTSVQDGTSTAPPNTGAAIGCNACTGLPRTLDQVDWHQREAQKWPQSEIDPPDTLLPAQLTGFKLLDALGDVLATEGFVDLSAVNVMGDVPAGVMHVTFRLVSQIPQTFTPIDYYFLADVDNNAKTGGGPGQFPVDSGLPSSSFTGVELIVRVRALLTGDICEVGCSTTFTLTPTVWLFQAGTFVEQSSSFARAFIQRNAGADNPPAAFEHLEAEFPFPVPTGNVRVQAITHDSASNTIDKLDDTDAGLAGSLAPPRFPVCGVTPGQVQPGVEANVTARDLAPNASAKIMLADLLLRTAPADANGTVNANFVVPSDTTRLGRRLITVGTLGTALTADCTVDVEGTAAVPVAVPVDAKPTSCPNPLNLNGQGVTPVAILGTGTLDVTQIDPASIILAGVTPIRYTYQDVAAPYTPYTNKAGANACTTHGPDDFEDLTMSFDTARIAAALGSVPNGQPLTLHLTGNFLPQYGGAPIVGEDVVVIKK
jgi:hypothetical protein